MNFRLQGYWENLTFLSRSESIINIRKNSLPYTGQVSILRKKREYDV